MISAQLHDSIQDQVKHDCAGPQYADERFGIGHDHPVEGKICQAPLCRLKDVDNLPRWASGDIFNAVCADPVGKGEAVAERAVLYLGVRIEVQQHAVPAAAPLLETVHVTTTPGCFVSNLTAWPLQLDPIGTLRKRSESLKVY